MLQRKLEQAKAEYQHALVEYRRLMGVSEDCSDMNEPSFHDGNLALRKALVIHTRARRKYEQVLREFTDFVLTGHANGHGQKAGLQN